MKRRITILTAAIALLAFLAIPMGMWGQTRSTTETLTISTYASANNWVNGTAYTPINTDHVTISGLTNGNNSKYYSSNSSWRHYEGDSGTVTVAISTDYASDYILSSVKFTYSAGNSGILKDGSTTVSSGSEYSISGTSKTFSVGHSSGTKNGNVQITSIEIIIEAVGGGDTPTLEDSDLAITGAPVALNFDLYNNSAAQTVNFTTSSTGAVTVSGGDGYVTTSVSGNTITVTPTAVTPSLQTITVSQAADDTYAAGSASFTVEVEDSTPFNGVIFDATEDTGTSPIVKDNVSFACTNGVLNNGSEYRLYKNSTTTISTTDGSTITRIEFTNASSNPATGFASQTGWTTNNNGGVWEGEATSVSFTASGAQVRATLIKVWVTPNTNPSIIAENVDIAYDAEEGTINYTINNPVDGGSITASCDAEWIEVDDTPQTDAEGSIDFICSPNSNFYAHSATVTLTYTYNDSKATVTKDVTVTQALDPDANGSTAEYPITVSEAIEAIDEVGNVSNSIYVGGIVSGIVEEYNSTYENITFDMIDEEGNEYFLRAYRCGGEEAANVAVGDAVVVYGTLYEYNNSIYEFHQGCQLVSLTHPQSTDPSITVTPALVEEDADEHDGTLDLTWENLEIEDIFNDFGIQYYDAEGEETLEPDWIEVLVAEQDPNEGEGYLVSYFMLENEGEARTAHFKVFAMGDEDFVYSNLVTINQAAPVVPGTNGTITFGSAEGSTKINSTSVTGDDSMGNTWTITTVFPNNNTSFTQNANYSQVGASSKPATSITFTTTLPAEAIVSAFKAKFGGFNNTAGDVTLLVDSETVGTGSLNASEDVIVQNTTTATGTVLTVTVTNIARGVKCYYISYTLGTSETETYTLEITGYEEGSNGGYYLIASPVTVDPATVDGMTSGDFDLYYYDESNDNEWRNYEANAFNLEPGKGYLYAKQATTEGEVFNFTLTGTPYAGNGTVELDYNEDSEFPGFNLIGNPFGTNATLNMPYYRLNSDRSGLNTSTETTEINVMEGVFVEATAEIQTATFSTGAKRVNQLNIKVTRNRGTVLDNAIIRFDNGATLGKFQINQNSTKLYITEGNQDYAVVCSNNEGEMPFNFKAAENGNYTLSVDAENVEVSYLHLIDNMNNADIDLLATPNYSFDARTTDNANRFRLVFNTNGVDENTTTASFAYFNGSEWTISNMGEATLQVVDMMGRVLSTQAISGNTEVSISQVPGVYMLRLINGENVMVQKVVVR